MKIVTLPFVREQDPVLDVHQDNGVKTRFKANSLQGFPQSRQPQHILHTDGTANNLVTTKGMSLGTKTQALGNILKGLKRNNGGNKQK